MVWNTSDYGQGRGLVLPHRRRPLDRVDLRLARLASGSLDQDVYVWNLNQPSKRIHISRMPPLRSLPTY